MNIVIKNKIANKINEYCKENNCAKTDIANQLKITRQALNGIENSKDLKVTTLIKISHVLKCKPCDLISYKIIIKD